MLQRHLGGADAQAPEAEAVDELAGGHLARDRVHEDRTGVLAAGLVLAPPADDLGQHLLRRSRSPWPRRKRATAPPGGRRGRSPGTQGEDAGRHLTILAAAQVEYADPRASRRCRTRGRRRSCAPPPPTEPGTPTAHSRPVRPAAAVCAPGPAGSTAPPATTSAPVGPSTPARTPRARRPGRGSRRRRRGGSSPGRRRARAARTAAAAVHAAEVGHGLRRAMSAAPADPVGRQRPERRPAPPAVPRIPAARATAAAGGLMTSPSRGPASTSSGSSLDVTAAHRDADVAGAQLADEERDEIGPLGQPRPPAARGGRRSTASTTSFR